jgi:hypothetical protein
MFCDSVSGRQQESRRIPATKKTALHRVVNSTKLKSDFRVRQADSALKCQLIFVKRYGRYRGKMAK